MDSFNGQDLFKQGQAMSQNAIQQLQAQEAAARAQRTQDNLERQRMEQNAQAEQRAAQQAARDAASNQYRDASMERQSARDYNTEEFKNRQSQSGIIDDYMDKYVGGYQRRLDALGKEYDQVNGRMLPTDQTRQDAFYKEAQYYNNVVAPALAKVGNITDVNAALTQVMGKKPLENAEHVKAIITPIWAELQSKGIRDPETIQRVLTEALNADVAARNPERGNEAVKARLAEIDSERQRINGLLQGSGLYNKLMSPQEYAAMRLGPMQMGQMGDPSQLSPPQTSKKQHYASGLAMIGTHKDGKPVHINPQSWGGTVTSEDGRVQIVPSVHATISDALQIERLNQGGGKALPQPVIEDDVDVPLKEPKAPAQKSPNLNQQVAEANNKQQTAQQAAAVKDLEGKFDGYFKQKASELGQVIDQFKKNPASGLSYDQVIFFLQSEAKKVADSQEARYLGITPQIAYERLTAKLPEFGVKTLPKRENNLQDLVNLGNNYRDFQGTKLSKIRGKQTNQLGEEITSNPWIRGQWVVPNNYDDIISYQQQMQAMQQGQGK